MNDHNCELPKKVEEAHPFASVVKLGRFNIKEVWRSWCGVSQYSPRCARYLDSMAAIAAERRRHFRLKYWWIIHPFSYFRFLWDTLMAAIYLIAFLTIPFMISFKVMDYMTLRFDKVNLAIYAICWLDILCNCITGYYDKKNRRVELKSSKIFKHYLKRFFIPDVLSSLPYDHITLPWRRAPGSDSYHIVTLLNTLPLLKLTRYCTLQSYIFYFFTYFEMKNFYYEMYTTLLLGTYLLFWSTCLCYMIPILVMHLFNIPSTECEDCWMVGLEHEILSHKFQHALFIVLENISGSGYGLFKPRAEGDVVLAIFLMIVGRLIECYIIVMLLQIKAARKASESKFQEIMNQLTAYTRQKQLPTHMKNRLLAYYHYRFKNSFFHEKEILSNLSEQLRQEIALQSCRRLVENVAIFRNLPKDILQSIVKNLKFELFLPNDVILKAGSQGDCMFFLSAGTVAVLTPTGKEICHLDDGAHFGEVALLVPDQRRVASVVAIEVCEVYRLDRRDFRKSIAVHSELFAKIERIAAERIQRAVVVEDQHKRYLMRSSFPHVEVQKKGKKKTVPKK